MQTPYVEQDCTFEFEGRKFSAGGAVLTDEFVIGYLAKDGKLTNWHGGPLGTYKITRSWPTPHSYMSSHMHQVEATVNGVVYTGRSAGLCMIYKGKRKAKQPRL